MARLILASALVTATLLSAGRALAFQCPKLIGQITATAGNRFDAAAADARAKAAGAEALHKAAKHADAVKLAKEGLAQLGVK